MPWKQESVVEQRLRYVTEARQSATALSSLCRRYEINRKTGWLGVQESIFGPWECAEINLMVDALSGLVYASTYFLVEVSSKH